mgnify:FL=1
MSKEIKPGIHYYIEGERVIFTPLFHLQRGSCCGNGCRHCPYTPKHKKGNKIPAEEFVKLKEST